MASHFELFMFLEFMNGQMENHNDQLIATKILENVHRIDDTSLEALSEICHISQASISRFIRKAGFKTFQQFKQSLSKSLFQLQFYRSPQLETLRFGNDLVKIKTMHYDAITSNLNETYESLDLNKLSNITNMIMKARDITIIGSQHSQDLFYTYQLDLLANGKVAYMFKTKQNLKQHICNLKDASLLLILSIEGRYLSSIQEEILEKVENRHNKTFILFTQKKILNEGFFDEVYYFGRNQDINYGYFSLHYLSLMMSSLLLMNQTPE